MVKKVLITLAILIVALFVGLFVLISLQPSTFMVQRSATMAAPPAEIFAQVNDLAAWHAWSPWSKLDPNPKRTFSTPSAGKGATFSWAGNDAVGEGSLTITESRPNELVELDQVFIRPFEGKARMTITFAPEGAGTLVTWRMDGANGFFGKALCMVIDMDTVLGKDFGEGLANMKALVEKGTAAPASR